jgi:hypothetical protein
MCASNSYTRPFFSILVTTALFAAPACGEDSADDEGSETGSDESGETNPTGDSGSDGSGESTDGATGDGDGDSAGDGDGDGEEFDCSVLPALPVASTHLTHVPASEDFTFDKDGYLWGVTVGDYALMRTPYSGSAELVVPNISSGGFGGFVRGTRLLPEQELVIADPATGELVRIDAQGAKSTIIGGLPDPNGVAIDQDGMVYLTHGGGEVRRIDPSDGSYEVIHSSGSSYDGITFSEDYKTLYFNEETGDIHKMSIADDGTVSAPTNFAYIDVGFGGILDGMTADVCGNIYVVEMTGSLYRITPEGQIDLAVDLGGGGGGGGPGGGGVFVPAVNFGSGVGGWKRDHVYIMNFEGGVFEANVGIPGKSEPHL